MTSLMFIIGVAVMFAMVLAWEASPEERERISLKPAGLLRWAVGGNWPAKVGALLLIIGTGALLRYFMLQIDLPPETKLMSGVIVAAGLGFVSGNLRGNPARRAIHLALGGASLGVAYLTAYSAYGFFQYVNEIEVLGMLFLVASGATAFALSGGALSIAMLAMIGAYIAPAFALQAPGPVEVYGYYAMASLMALLMVYSRGWRPLIHLSFLFTLAGALFFGWTYKYYTPEYYAHMQPLLYILVAIHLAMPILESRKTSDDDGNTWIQRFDSGYFLLLPLTACLLTLSIAPAVSSDGAWGIGGLAILWLMAAGISRRCSYDAGSRYLGVALMLFLVSAMLAVDSSSYYFLLAVLSCAAIAIGPRFGLFGNLGGVLTVVALASFSGFLAQSLGHARPETPFANLQYVRHLIMAAALGSAGMSLKKQGSSLAKAFMVIAIVWALSSSVREVVQMHLVNLPQILHLGLLIATVAYAAWSRRSGPNMLFTVLLAGGLFLTAMSSAGMFSFTSLLLLMLAGQVVFLAHAYAASRQGEEGRLVSGLAYGILPILAFPWAVAFSRSLAQPQTMAVMTLLASSALLASVTAQATTIETDRKPNKLSPLGFLVFGGCLLFVSLFHIEREVWGVAFELVALSYLVSTARLMLSTSDINARAYALVTGIAMASVSVAMILRLLGPADPILTIFDLRRMLLPAMVSLIWAMIGAVLAWWSTRSQSRSLWTIGSVFLVASAVKLVLFDFGSLGQLGNIIAMMAAGGVFMLVAWLAPIPPKQEKPAKDGKTEESSLLPVAVVAVIVIMAMGGLSELFKDKQVKAGTTSAAQIYFPGKEQVEEAVKQGLLRPATSRDAELWTRELARKYSDKGKPMPDLPPSLLNAYVVLKPYTYPTQLKKGGDATFYVPKGIPIPKGDFGYSREYDFNSMTLGCSMASECGQAMMNGKLGAGSTELSVSTGSNGAGPMGIGSGSK